MTIFLDGPAVEAKGLFLRRAPTYLRVVFNTDTKEFDALDQLDDKPQWNEDLYAYRLVKNEGWIHICRRPHGSGTFQRATYAYVQDQPPEAVMRSNAAWAKWATEQATKQPQREDGTP